MQKFPVNSQVTPADTETLDGKPDTTIENINTKEQGVQTGNPFDSLETFIYTQIKIIGNEKLNDLFMRQADIKRIFEMAKENLILKQYVDGLKEKLKILERRYNIQEFEESSIEPITDQRQESPASIPDFQIERVAAMPHTGFDQMEKTNILESSHNIKEFEDQQPSERQESPTSIPDFQIERVAPMSQPRFDQNLHNGFSESTVSPFSPTDGTSFPHGMFHLTGQSQKHVSSPVPRKRRCLSRGPPNVEVIKDQCAPGNFIDFPPRYYRPMLNKCDPCYKPYLPYQNNEDVQRNSNIRKPRRNSAFQPVHRFPIPESCMPVHRPVSYNDPSFWTSLEKDLFHGVNLGAERFENYQNRLQKYNPRLPFDVNMQSLASRYPQPLEAVRPSISPQPDVVLLSPPLTPQPQLTPQGPNDIVIVSNKLPDGLLEMRDFYAEQMIERNAKLNPCTSIMGI